MKNIELLHDAALISENKKVQELIQKFILSNELQTKSKFNPYDYSAGKSDFRETLRGVYHSNGFKVATNGTILIAYKGNYPIEIEGKIIGRTGEEVDGTYPNWQSVIPNNDKLNFTPIDFKKVLDIEREFKVVKKTSEDYIGLIKIGDAYFHIGLMAKMAKFALNFGITEIGTNGYDKPAKIFSCENIAILMPMMRDEDNKNIKTYTL